MARIFFIYLIPLNTKDTKVTKVLYIAQQVDFFLTIFRDCSEQRITTVAQPNFVYFVSFVFESHF
ncbi:MAG: hypothetical protein DCC56_02045 [Anaerolineae bacterium]|nr:MAG: hypothetical protein DCC56_02045 [Anaerolineae bacterium]